jgi:hypothetical protein
VRRTPLPVPVLITSAIAVSAAQTVLIDTQSRLKLTLESIRQWRRMPAVKAVVVCDGSGFDLGPHINGRLSTGTAVECEVLKFTNDLAGVKSKGKGYGEGQIVNYALEQSRLLSEAASFAKCTGKLWVENYSDCAQRYNGLAAFDYLGKFKVKAIDTRFYIVNRDFFRAHLATAHNDVNDAEGYYLEHAFTASLTQLKLSDYIMVPTPRIRGVAGSTGVTYGSDRLKAALRDIRSVVAKSIGDYF